MPTVRDNAVCIRHWDFSETSQTVSLLSREHGMLRGLAKGAKREKGTFSGGLDVLTRGEVVAIVKSGRELATLTHWDLQEIFRAVRTNLQANRAGLYMADLVHHLMRDSEPHPAIFDALVDALRAMNEPSEIGPALLRFQWLTLRETGFQPELYRNTETGIDIDANAPTVAFRAASGGLVTDTGADDRWRVRRETLELLRAVDRGASTLHPPPDATRRANQLLACYAREVLGQDLPTIRWMFPDLVR